METLKAAGFTVKFEKVKGHSGNAGNDMADKLAKGGHIQGALPLKHLFD
jgi:ribonuclease HI